MKTLTRTLFLLLTVAVLLAVLPLPVSASDVELYYQANTAYWNGKYTSAIDIYRNLLRDYPRSELRPRVYFSLGSAYFSLDEYDKAAGWYEKLLNDENPGEELRVDALYKLGQCHMQTGNYQRAGLALAELLQKYPTALVSGRAALLLDQARERGYVAGAAAPPLVGGRPPAANPTATTRPPGAVAPRESGHVVQPGESLSSIARDRLGDPGRYLELAQLNNIPAPYTISVGQRLLLAAAAANPPAAVLPVAVAVPPLYQPSPPSQPAAYADQSFVAALQQEISQVRQQLAYASDRVREESLRADRAEQRLRLEGDSLAQLVRDRDAAVLGTRAELQARLAALEEELRARQEKLARTQEAFDALHLRYQALENALTTQEQQLNSHGQLNESVVRKLKDLQVQVDGLTAELERTRAANEARVTQLTQAGEQRVTALTTALQTAESERARLDAEVRSLRLAREQLDSQLRRVQETQSSAQLALAFVEQGRVARQAGNYPVAMQAYSQALAKDPRSADALNGLAYVYAELNDSLPRARELVAAAIENNPQAKGYYLVTSRAHG